jgi:hypothetical protein
MASQISLKPTNAQISFDCNQKYAEYKISAFKTLYSY